MGILGHSSKSILNYVYRYREAAGRLWDGRPVPINITVYAMHLRNQTLGPQGTCKSWPGSELRANPCQRLSLGCQYQLSPRDRLLEGHGWVSTVREPFSRSFMQSIQRIDDFVIGIEKTNALCICTANFAAYFGARSDISILTYH